MAYIYHYVAKDSKSTISIDGVVHSLLKVKSMKEYNEIKQGLITEFNLDPKVNLIITSLSLLHEEV